MPTITRRIVGKVAATVAPRLPEPAARRVFGGLMDDRGKLHDFWRQEAPEGNIPEGYIAPVWRSEALLELIADLPTDSRILEVGCNIGRNLAYLHDHGYRNVTGVEISPHAVELLRQTYPQLANREIHVGAAEDVLPTLPDAAFDLVFTMAVIEHIHPDSTVIFDNMVRVAPLILAIEPQPRSTHRQHPHDVPALFKARGAELVSTVLMSSFPKAAADPAISDYVAWRFEVRHDT